MILLIKLATDDYKCEYYDPESVGEIEDEKAKFKFGFLYINIHSLYRKIDDLKARLSTFSINGIGVQIILLCGTFMKHHMEKHCSIPNVNLLSQNRNESKGGGVAMYVNVDLC